MYHGPKDFACFTSETVTRMHHSKKHASGNETGYEYFSS